MPIAIRVNMFGLRLTIEAQPRSKKGQPAQSTTGVEKTSAIQLLTCGSIRPPSPMPRSMSPIASRKTGSPSAAPIQKRRVMSTSSGFGRSSSVAVRGSSAMPQIGQLPGPFLTISGCMGHVYSTSSPAGIIGAGFAAGLRYDSGSFLNRTRHDGLQK
jgi:hypothetical protein